MAVGTADTEPRRSPDKPPHCSRAVAVVALPGMWAATVALGLAGAAILGRARHAASTTSLSADWVQVLAALTVAAFLCSLVARGVRRGPE